MATNRVHVSYNEMYDLSTIENGLGMIALHTPRLSDIQSKFKGLFENFKYVKFDYMDFRLSCASMLPLDPLQVGLEAGMVAPQDIFNPILYKTVSNESMNLLENYIYSLIGNLGSNATEIQGVSLDYDANSIAGRGANAPQTLYDPLDVYYGLLSNQGFAKALPQQGVSMSKVVPFAHKLVANVAPGGSYNAGVDGAMDGNAGTNIGGEFWIPGNITSSSAGTDITARRYPVVTYGNGCVPMPRVPTMMYKPSTTGDEDLAQQFVINDPVPIYCACVILPPAILQRLFFRCVVTWHITFTEFVPSDQHISLGNLATAGQSFYGSDYATQSASYSVRGTSLDVNDMVLEPTTTSAY